MAQNGVTMRKVSKYEGFFVLFFFSQYFDRILRFTYGLVRTVLMQWCRCCWKLSWFMKTNFLHYFVHSSLCLYRSSCLDVLCKKGVLINFTKFAGKHLCQSLFFDKVAGGACWLLNLVCPNHWSMLFSFKSHFMIVKLVL